MNWKSTLVLLVATVAIGAYISAYEIRQPSPHRRDERSRRVVHIPAETVTEVVIERPETRLTLIRDGTLWRMMPDGVRADVGLISDILGYTAWLIAERIISDAPGTAPEDAAYGLDPAPLRLTLVTADASTTLSFGDSTAVGSGQFVRSDDHPAVFVIDPGLFDLVNQPAEVFRDRRLIRFNSFTADALAFRSPEAAFRLERREDHWHVIEPVDDRADRAKVDALLRQLSNIKIHRFLDDETGVEPVAEAELTYGEPPDSIRLTFGEALEDDAALIRAARSDESRVYAIARSDIEGLVNDPADLRARACFDYFTGEVRQVDVAWEDAPWTIERIDGVWRAKASGTELDTHQVEAFLNGLADVRASGFVEDDIADLDRFGLAEPGGSITIRTVDSGDPQRLFIGALHPEASIRYGLLESRDVLVELSEEILNDLLTTTPNDLLPEIASSQLTASD